VCTFLSRRYPYGSESRQLISRGPHTWLVSVSLGRDQESGPRNYHNKTIRGSFREAHTYPEREAAGVRDWTPFQCGGDQSQPILGSVARNGSQAEVGQKSYTDYESLLRPYIRPVLGTKPLGAIVQFDIQSVYARMFDCGLSSRTIEYMNSVLQSAFRQAVRWKMLVESGKLPGLRRYS